MERRLWIILSIILCASLCLAQAGQIVDMSFVDDSHGWLAVMEPSPVLFRTSNAGKTWTRIAEPGFFRIRFFDRQKGIALRGVSESEFDIYLTSNGGEDWRKIAAVKRQLLHAVDLAFSGPDRAFILAEGSGGVGWVGELDLNGVLKERTDLPVNFEEQSPVAIFGDGAGHLWIVGKEMVLHSADAGRNWENQYENTDPHLDLGESGVAIPGGLAWFAAANWEIYRTQDFGRSWTVALNTDEQELTVNFEGISFVSPGRGCAVGDSDLIFCTDDGGLKWKSKRVFKTFLAGSPFSSRLQLFDSQLGWAIVAGDLYKTENGGNSFAEMFSDPDVASSVPGETKALKTSINGPNGLAFYDGHLYVAEMTQQRLLRVDLTHSSVKTLSEAPGGVDFSEAQALASDGRGNIWIGDFDGSLKKLNTHSGEITTIAGKSIWPEMSYPSGMAFEVDGSLIVSSAHQLLRWNASQRKWEQFAGSQGGFGGDGGPAKDAAFRNVDGIAASVTGDIYVADYENCRIRKIDHETQIVTTIAGTGNCETGSGDGGQAILATMHWPSAVTVDGKNNIFFIEGNRVRRIDADGMITAYAGTVK